MTDAAQPNLSYIHFHLQRPMPWKAVPLLQSNSSEFRRTLLVPFILGIFGGFEALLAILHLRLLCARQLETVAGNAQGDCLLPCVCALLVTMHGLQVI